MNKYSKLSRKNVKKIGHEDNPEFFRDFFPLSMYSLVLSSGRWTGETSWKIFLRGVNRLLVTVYTFQCARRVAAGVGGAVGVHRAPRKHPYPPCRRASNALRSAKPSQNSSSRVGASSLILPGAYGRPRNALGAPRRAGAPAKKLRRPSFLLQLHTKLNTFLATSDTLHISSFNCV